MSTGIAGALVYVDVTVALFHGAELSVFKCRHAARVVAHSPCKPSSACACVCVDRHRPRSRIGAHSAVLARLGGTFVHVNLTIVTFPARKAVALVGSDGNSIILGRVDACATVSARIFIALVYVRATIVNHSNGGEARRAEALVGIGRDADVYCRFRTSAFVQARRANTLVYIGATVPALARHRTVMHPALGCVLRNSDLRARPIRKSSCAATAVGGNLVRALCAVAARGALALVDVDVAVATRANPS